MALSRAVAAEGATCPHTSVAGAGLAVVCFWAGLLGLKQVGLTTLLGLYIRQETQTTLFYLQDVNSRGNILRYLLVYTRMSSLY